MTMGDMAAPCEGIAMGDTMYARFDPERHGVAVLVDAGRDPAGLPLSGLVRGPAGTGGRAAAL